MKHLDASGYDTDKIEMGHYLRRYERYFAGLADREISLLELGVRKGGSLQMWRDYFPRGAIAGVDIKRVKLDDPSGRIRLFQGRQEDTAFLDRVAAETKTPFDIIIDDCSHFGELTRISFWHLFDRYLKPGGIYAIEDWCTGYWDDWPDGRHYRSGSTSNSRASRVFSRAERLVNSYPVRRLLRKAPDFPWPVFFPTHSYGMVGFVKELVDECAMADITRADHGRPPFRQSKIQDLNISHGLVMVTKASGEIASAPDGP